MFKQKLLNFLNTKQHYNNRVSLQIVNSIEQPILDYQKYVVTNTDLPNSFQVWYSSQILHLWMVLFPLNPDPHLTKNLIDLVFVETEDRLARMDVPQQKLMKSLWEQCIGMTKAYDSGLSADTNANKDILDGNLKNAITRNVLQNRKFPKVADASVRYIRSNLIYTMGLTIEDCEGKLTFPVKIGK